MEWIKRVASLFIEFDDAGKNDNGSEIFEPVIDTDCELIKSLNNIDNFFKIVEYDGKYIPMTRYYDNGSLRAEWMGISNTLHCYTTPSIIHETCMCLTEKGAQNIIDMFKDNHFKKLERTNNKIKFEKFWEKINDTL